jgi:hypothetical protein
LLRARKLWLKSARGELSRLRRVLSMSAWIGIGMPPAVLARAAEIIK